MKTGLLVLVLGFDAVERVTEEALLHRSPKRQSAVEN
jgi:hypothetical protein